MSRSPISIKPKIAMKSGPPPKRLTSRDLIQGTGTEAKTGDEITVQYLGVDYKTGKEFESSWRFDEPFTFTLGAGEVIAGWDQGLPGMKVGGRRELVVPPNLAYHALHEMGVLSPHTTLVFMVDLIAVK